MGEKENLLGEKKTCWGRRKTRFGKPVEKKKNLKFNKQIKTDEKVVAELVAKYKMYKSEKDIPPKRNPDINLST